MDDSFKLTAMHVLQETLALGNAHNVNNNISEESETPAKDQAMNVQPGFGTQPPLATSRERDKSPLDPTTPPSRATVNKDTIKDPSMPPTSLEPYSPG